MKGRWLKKREFAIYYMLWKTYGDNCVNKGILLEFIAKITGSKKVSRSILSMLVKKGLVEKCGSVSYRVKSFEEAFSLTVLSYLLQRLKRQGRINSYSISAADNNITIVVHASDKDCTDILSLIEPVKQKTVFVNCVTG